MIDTLTNSIREADDLLDQMSLAWEWREWFNKNEENDILFVSEVLNENHNKNPRRIRAEESQKNTDIFRCKF